MAITSIKTGSSFTNLIKYNDFLGPNSAYIPVTLDYKTMSFYGKIYDSTDGLTWTFSTSVQNNTNNAGDIAPVGRSFYVANNKLFGTFTNVQMYTSTDGSTWGPLNANLTNAASIIHDGTQYLATSNNPYGFAVSTDSLKWTYRTSPYNTNNNNAVIAYGNSTYVVTNKGFGTGFIYSSTDAITWTSRTAGHTSPVYSMVRYVNNIFMVVGSCTNTNATTGAIATSTNGVTWTSRTPATGTTGSRPLVDIAYGNSKYVVAGSSTSGGGAYYSTDGTTWSTGYSSTGSGFNSTALTYNAAAGFASLASNTTVYRSTDGITWNSASGPLTAVNTKSVVYFNSKYVCGNASATSASAIYTTTNLTTFTSITTGQPTTGAYNTAFRKANSVYFALGAQVLQYSTDLVTWTSRTLGAIATSIDYGNGTYVAVGANGATTIFTSTNLVTWTTRTTAYNDQNVVAYGNGYFVSGGDGIQYSTDGITWSTANATISIYNIYYVNSKWVAISYSDLVAYTSGSNPSTGWSTASISGTAMGAYAMAYGNGIYLIGGASSIYSKSTNLVTWTTGTVPISSSSWDTVAWDGSKFILFTGSNVGDGLMVYVTSTDGTTWTSRTSNVMYSEEGVLRMVNASAVL
jgi:hypothetical protein